MLNVVLQQVNPRISSLYTPLIRVLVAKIRLSCIGSLLG